MGDAQILSETTAVVVVVNLESFVGKEIGIDILLPYQGGRPRALLAVLLSVGPYGIVVRDNMGRRFFPFHVIEHIDLGE